ncbi:MAG: non-homologous end-joining DNA ligase [Chloroflexota bacterium]
MTVRHGRRSKAEAVPATLSRPNLPRVIEPMLPTPVSEPFDSPAHIYEVLWDGVRALTFVENGTVRLQDRWGRDVTQRFPELATIANRLRESGMVIDGEIVCLDGDGKPDFSRLRHRLAADDPKTIREQAERYPVTLQAFDLVYRERQPVTGWPLRRRKEMLRGLVRPDATIAVPDYVAKDGIAFFEAAREHHLEGIVAKEADSRYTPGERSRAWLTVRSQQKRDFIVGGFTYGGRWNPRGGSPSREAISSLLLGLLREDGRLQFAGEVSGGFQDELGELVKRLDDATTTACPFADAPTPERLVFWCRPEVVAAITYADIAADGRLRFPVYKALRPDVPAESCRVSEAD